MDIVLLTGTKEEHGAEIITNRLFRNKRLVDDSAKNAFHSNPTNTVFDANRLIGCKVDEAEL
jgi:molecular chaperone DnaK (HSP70)